MVMKLILASTSRYRRELLQRLHVSFDAIPPGIDETAHPNERPGPLSLRLSIEKAAAVSEAHPDAVVIGSDQTATIDGLQSIGKPGTHERAVAQLIAARRHQRGEHRLRRAFAQGNAFLAETGAAVGIGIKDDLGKGAHRNFPIW